jgi:hypothetical protein
MQAPVLLTNDELAIRQRAARGMERIHAQLRGWQ